jgi:peptidoglycan/LPS O-acetylase OafA/YrhL
MKLSIKMPRLQLQQQSQLGEDSYHSLLISLMRGLAAVQVAAAHLRSEVFPSLRALEEPSRWYQALAFATGFAHQAVVVFFLISGWLVGGSLLNKIGQPQAIASYAIDRMTRLWTVLIPTYLLMLLLGVGMDVLNPKSLDLSVANPYSLPSFLGNLIGLQTVAVPNFGANYALWSLANESWYYLLFPLLLLAFRGSGAGRAASAAAILLIAALLPPVLTSYFSLWLLGAGFSRLKLACGTSTHIALLAILASVSVYYRLTGTNDDLGMHSLLQDLVCSLPFLLLLSSLQIKTNRASRSLKRIAALAGFFANFSFTLYVLHVPLIGMLRYAAIAVLGTDRLSPHVGLDYAIYFGMLACILACAYLSYLVFESQTYRIRRLLKGIFLQQPKADARQAALPADS